MDYNYEEYIAYKQAFLKAHDDWTVETSPMDEYGCYHKEYVCNDGAIWYEVMSPQYVIEEVTIHRCHCKVEVKMLRTEFWNSDDSISKYYYEKF